ncbi:MAG TPA: sigma-70 family RNA polymerase sigma factor [Planctomycetaceae bacterium]|nr:sigma-70 family RNA polymerase sigma factor [Planctomycetaceae bacterium]
MDDGTNWKSWIESHAAVLLLYARQWSPLQSDAEDVLQEAFLRFWKNRHDAQDPKAYMFACVRSAGVDFLRARRSRDRFEQQARLDRSNLEWFRLSDEGDETRIAVAAALRRLPSEQQETVILKIWGNLTFEQIGRTMQVSPHTAASRYRYALLSLKKWLLQDQLS